MKPVIRSTEGGWTVTRPAYGFGQPTVETYPTWKAAVAFLKGSPGAAGPIVERAGSTTVAYSTWYALPSRKTIVGETP